MKLEEYLKELNKVRLLTSNEEHTLWHQYKECGDQASRQHLIESYQPLVFKLAMPFKTMDCIMDILQEGTVGLIESVEGYDYQRGVAFSVFASYRIAGRIKNFLRREGMADEAVLEAVDENGCSAIDLLTDEAAVPVSEQAELHEIANCLRAAMERLPINERLVLDQVYIQSHDVSDVADLLKVSNSHVYRLQKKGISRVRGMLSSFMHHWK